MAIATVDPNTGNTIRTFQPHTDAQLEEKLARAVVGARLQRELPIAERAKRMARAAEILHVRREELGRLMTLEMGKLKNAALAEVDKCALGCRYYADHGAAFMADEPVKTDAPRSMIRYQPLGVVLAVMPWNFPLWQVFRFAAPGLVAGNAAVLKHASNVPQCAQAIEDVFRAAGFPDGAFQTLLVEGSRASKLLDDLEDQVKRMVAKGSKVLAGGKRLDRPGFFFQPTLLTDAGPGTPGRDEELFGPVATIFRVRDAGEALQIANATKFGLGSAAWTRDAAEVRRFTDELQAGQVFINGMVKSDPRLPFGGIKASGHGRELSAIGMREFVNWKTVWIGEGGEQAFSGTE